MDLIKDLKKQHRDLGYFIQEIEEDIKDRQTEKIISKLQILLQDITSHVDIEDKLLYPVLAKSEHTEIKKIGELFTKEMADISKQATEFMKKNKKIKKADIESSRLNKEILGLLNKIKRRIMIEEEILFPAYEKYV
jgi:hemerythrin-like domain-containing protein